MLIKINQLRAQSTVEYAAFLVILIGVFIYFQKYLVRGISGRLKATGDSFAQGRIYDPNQTTTECKYDFAYGTNIWYDAKKFFDKDPKIGCEALCLGSQLKSTECEECPKLCRNCIRWAAKDLEQAGKKNICDTPDTPSSEEGYDFETIEFPETCDKDEYTRTKTCVFCKAKDGIHKECITCYDMSLNVMALLGMFGPNVVCSDGSVKIDPSNFF